MRILSLLPSSTEIVCILGLEEHLVGRSHDSDFPLSIHNIPIVTTTEIDTSKKSKEIDTFVRNAKHIGRSLYHIDTTLLKKLHPTLVITQELCDVCAISFTEVRRASRYVASDTNLLSLEPESIGDMLENIRTIASLTGKDDYGEKIIADLEKRLRIIQSKLPATQIPNVVIVEWLDPLMIPGHWVPEMVKKAGGKLLLSKPRDKSRNVSWNEILANDPDFLIFAPCGFTIERTLKEKDTILNLPDYASLTAVKNQNVYVMNGDAYLTRSGPRLIDGVEILSQIFFPDVYGTVKKEAAVHLD